MTFAIRPRALPALLLLALAAAAQPALAQKNSFRPPAVPLVTFDPYLSIWSEADHLTDDTTRHWTHHEHPLVSLIRVDGKTYRLMGKEPVEAPALPQVGLTVTPTRSLYTFRNEAVQVDLTFMTAALPTDLEVFARPLSYITWRVRSLDGQSHKATLYDSVSGLLAVNTPRQQVDWKRERAGALTALRVGTISQRVLGSAGDDHRIDWGYAYLAASATQASPVIGAAPSLEAEFVRSGKVPEEDDTRAPRAANDDEPVLAATFDLGVVDAQPVSRHVIVAYDELYAIKYFRKNLRPYWRRNGASATDMLQAAERDYAGVTRRCEQFDSRLVADMTKTGGKEYARVAALAYRECAAACGLAADANGQPLYFTKENTSNGDIATVDVFFPMDPVWIFLSPTLAKATLVPILDYAASDHWKFPNAPHDLGTYPIASGTDDGGEGMPVEESGNMLILCDAVAQAEGSAEFASRWWPKLTQWAEYLEKYGLDPEEQLCTDDFMGHLAHNANLSVKAILGLAAYGDMCRMRGDAANAEKYQREARVDAQHWIGATEDGGHSRLAFDKPGTWSQKYNLVWDHILGLNVFPASVAQREVAYYKKVMQKYGVPLDSRTRLTKTDWSYWSATLADNRRDFETLTLPIYNYLDETTARDPIADSYITDNVKSGGMHARPVVGGFFIKMLSDRPMWKKWASMDHEHVGPWAPLPPRPVVTEVVPTSKLSPIEWRYTTEKPADGWTKPGFDDSTWMQAPALFGTVGNPRTRWTSPDIWIRREVTVPEGSYANLQLSVFHDEDVEIYVDGVLAATEAGYNVNYELLDIAPQARALLKSGAKVVIAAHCHQTTGGQAIDIGLVNVVDKK
jgi:hypothetical protein